MNELTAEWIEKAEGDYAIAVRELRARRRPNLDRYAVCYRYPGESADKAKARQALRAVKAVRAFLRQKFGPYFSGG